VEQQRTGARSQVGRQVSPTVTHLALAGVIAAVIAVFSLLSIPVGTVPLTLQTLAVLLAGGLLGPLWGAVSVLVYLLVGLVGVPVFAGGEAGLHVLVGPKGGFLMGFVVAAFLMGLAGRAARARGLTTRAGLVWLIAGAVAASVAIYLVGVPWLAAVTGLSLHKAFVVGCAPFLLTDALKAAVAVLLVRSVGAALDREGLI
jgi:biotin transport system substrate-specific component